MRADHLATRIFAADGERLTSQVLNDPPLTYIGIKPDWFLAGNGILVRFEREQGKIRRVFIQAGRVTNLMFEHR